jgi:magnesium-transporting ATPase (P-type)
VFEILTLCHTTIATKNKLPGGYTKHFSTNPDELAFVSFGKFCGWEFLGKSETKQGVTVIRTEEQDLEYKVELTFPFSSKRKRMSVVIQDMATGKYRLLTKGADEVIMPRTISCVCFTKENLQESINSYSKLGLRTMVLAFREISKEEFSTLRDAVHQTNGMKPYRRFEELDNIYEQTERDYCMVGATAVED